LVTRPAIPLPCSPAIWIPCSAAIFRTRGDDLVRMRSSNEPGVAAGAAGAAGAVAAGTMAGAVEWFGATTGAATDSIAGGPPATGAAGALGAAAGIAAAALASVSNRATTVCTATVCPSVTRISTSTPADGAGISASTLSVEISNSGSSRLMVSPTFLSQRDIVPSAIDSPIWGMTTSMRAKGSPSRVLSSRRRAPSGSRCRDASSRRRNNAGRASGAPSPGIPPARRAALNLCRRAPPL